MFGIFLPIEPIYAIIPHFGCYFSQLDYWNLLLGPALSSSVLLRDLFLHLKNLMYSNSFGSRSKVPSVICRDFLCSNLASILFSCKFEDPGLVPWRFLFLLSWFSSLKAILQEGLPVVWGKTNDLPCQVFGPWLVDAAQVAFFSCWSDNVLRTWDHCLWICRSTRFMS